ncbi:MAG: putative Ig domain-containing protein [bacterium]
MIITQREKAFVPTKHSPRIRCTICRPIFTPLCSALLFVASFAVSPVAGFYNLPICRANGDQSTPAVVGDGGDGAFVLWLDERGQEPKIFCQRLNQLAQPQWQINGLEVARTSGRHERFTAIADGSGGIIIVWQEAAENDDGDIFAQRLDQAGTRLWGETGKEVHRRGHEQGSPMVVGDGAGGAIVLWQDERDGNWDIFAQRINANGDGLWNPGSVALVQEPRDQVLGDAIAISGQGFVVAWRDERAIAGRVFVQRFDLNGSKIWNDAVWVAQSLSDQNHPRLALDAGNPGDISTYVAWIERRLLVPTIYMQRLNAGGLLQWGTLGLAAGRGIGEQREMQALNGNDGELIMVWEDARNDQGDIYAQRVSRDGRTLWPAVGLPVIQAEQGQHHPRAVRNTAGGFDCAWEDDRGDGTNIAMQRVDAAGTTLWSPGAVVLTDHGNETSSPAVLSRTSGRALVAWKDGRVPNDDVYAQPLTAGGELENVPPAITSIPPSTAYVNTAYVYNITSFDFDSGDPPALALLAAPAWLQLIQPQMVLQGAPGPADEAEVEVIIQASDAEGGTTLQNFKLQVLQDPAAPKITSLPDTTAVEDARYRYQIQVHDPDPQEVLQYELQTAAAWLALSSQGELSGRPLNEHVGVHAVKITVTNRKGKSDQQQFSLNVENTNDPPVFTGSPDTVAFVDSLYQYRVATHDVDVGDRVSLTLAQAPSWLHWDAATRTLSGTPRLPDAGTHTIAFQAQDLARSITLQEFSLRVYNLGAPDAEAPSAPQDAVLTPARWSRSPDFTVSWRNPFDPSGIAGAFYKIGAPPDGNRDGTLVSLSDPQETPEIIIQVTNEGQNPVYIWLIDGSGNVDYRTAVRVDCRYDVSAPQAASHLRAGNAFGWANQDTVPFAWQSADDALAGVAWHEVVLAGKTIRRLSGATTGFLLDTMLVEGRYDWQIVALDSAGNTATSAPGGFRVDRTPPALSHTPFDTVEAGQVLTVRATARDQLAGIASVRVLFRTAGVSDFTEIPMSPSAGAFAGSLLGAAIQSPGLQYVILATDSAGNVGRSTPNPRAVHAPVVRSQLIFAPMTTRDEYYQLVSIPYRLFANTPDAIFADNFGVYEPTRWRLYMFAPRAGNIEFGRPKFQQLEPGRAYWLITSKRQSFDAGAGYSISTAQNFVLELQPGWNLISTPFDFTTDWNSTQKPPLVESQLWAYDGRKYLANGRMMQPWQGYFVRNLSDQPQTLVFPPPCAECATNSVTSRTGNGSAEAHAGESLQIADGNGLGETPASFGLYPEDDLPAAPTPSRWQLQLLLSDGDFADTQNWLGVATEAQEEWDRMELSEPPPAAGKFVALRFPQQHWKEFQGDFTTDFRPDSPSVKEWIFEVCSNAAGDALSLSFQLMGEFPHGWKVLLRDESERLVRSVDFGAQGRSRAFPIRSSAGPRRFVLCAGSAEDLGKTGLLAAVLPQTFSLAPSYPNPARLQTHGQAVSTMRFSLPVAAEVELVIWSVLGHPVRALLHKQVVAAGHHEILWNGRDDANQTVAAGVYFCRMKTEQFTAIQKIILLH